MQLRERIKQAGFLRINAQSILSLLAVFVAIGFMVVLTGATEFPKKFYEETGWLIVNSRALQDGFFMHHYHFLCKTSLSYPIPPSLIPGRIVASLLHPDSHSGARHVGAVIYLLIIATMTASCVLLQQRKYPVITFGVVAALLSVGILPYRMVSIRPETSIALGVLLAALLLIFHRMHPPSRGRQYIAAIGFMLVCSWLMGTHPKAVLFSPFLLLVAWFGFSLRKLKIVQVLLIIIMTWQSYDMWQNFLHCKDFVPVERVHNARYISPSKMIRQPQYALLEFAKQWAALKTLQLDSTLNDKPFNKSKLFKPKGSMAVLDRINRYVIYFLLGTLLLLSLAAVVMLSRKKWRMPLTGGQAWIIIASSALLALTILAFVGIKRGQSFYEAGMVLPLLVFPFLLVVMPLLSRPGMRKIAAASVVVLFTSSLFNTFLISRYNYDITDQWREWLGSTGHKPTTIEKNDAKIPVVKELAAQCGIATDKQSQHILIDSTTYLALHNTQNPLNTGVMPLTYRLKGDGLASYLRELGSDGIVMRCGKFSKFKMPYSHSDQGFCCVSKYDLQKYADRHEKHIRQQRRAQKKKQKQKAGAPE